MIMRPIKIFDVCKLAESNDLSHSNWTYAFGRIAYKKDKYVLIFAYSFTFRFTYYNSFSDLQLDFCKRLKRLVGASECYDLTNYGFDFISSQIGIL